MKKTKTRDRARKPKSAHTAPETLRAAWAEAQHALHTAQRAAEKQVKEALKRNRIGGRQASEVVSDLALRFERERRKARRSVEAQIGVLAKRVRRERRAAGRRVGQAVEQALSALNIPSRREVAELTQKVAELSRKIDTLKRRK